MNRFQTAFLIPISLVAAFGLPALAEDEPGIADNSFLIEEAYNQPPGVVQHIQNLTWSRDKEGATKERSLAYNFTQEWPVFSVKHQLSYSIPYSYTHTLGTNSQEGIGDVQVNYRYQLWEENAVRPAFSPRLSVILPTGDELKGTGTDEIGWQMNLPFSKGVGDFHYNLNLGATLTPDDDVMLDAGGRSPKHDLLSYSAGGSLIYTHSARFQPLLECVVANTESIGTTDGERAEETSLTVSPGFRYAWNYPSGSQLVFGLAAPVALSRAGNDYGVIGYLSWEHAFSKEGRE